MLLGAFFLLPALCLAAHGDPVDKRCGGVANLSPPVTVTSVLATQTYGPQAGHESACSMTYTMVLPSLSPGSGPGSPGGLRPHTYTVTCACDGTDLFPCELPDSKEICPPGFIKTTTVCNTCGDSPATYTLTVLDPSPTTPHLVATGKEKSPAATASPPTPGTKSGHCDKEPCSELGNTEKQQDATNNVATGNTEKQEDATNNVATQGLGGTTEVVGGGAGFDNAGGKVSKPDTAGEHVEVSGGASVKFTQRLAETFLVPVILAAVNVPL